MGTDLPRLVNVSARRAGGRLCVGRERAFDAPWYWSRIIYGICTHVACRACNRLGRTTEGLSYLTEAEQIIETTNDAFAEAELHRVRGDLLNANGDLAGADLSYQQAIAIAKQRKCRNTDDSAPPPVSPVSGAIRASAKRLANFSLRSTAGLLKGLIRSI